MKEFRKCVVADGDGKTKRTRWRSIFWYMRTRVSEAHLKGANERDGVKTRYFVGKGFDEKFNDWVKGVYRSGERVTRRNE